MEHDVHIYTDGAAKGNPGNGGYGVVMDMTRQAITVSKIHLQYLFLKDSTNGQNQV